MRTAVATAILAWFGTGFAADGAPASATGCLPVAGGGALSVEGVGRVVFAELATDRVRDAATFGGRVCLALEGSDVVFRTDRLDATGLAGPLTLTATGVRVDVPGWTLEAASLRGGPGWAELADVAIVGEDAVGLARTMRVEFDSGVLVASELRLLTPSIRIDAASASLDGTVLVAESARVSSCECPPEEAPMRVDAVRVRLDLDDEVSALVEGGMVVVGRVRWPLGDAVTLDAETLEDLALPIALGPDPDRDGAWRLALLAREVAPGARVSAAFTTGVPDAPARAGVALTAEGPGVSASWSGATDRWSADLRGGAVLGGGWRVDARQRFEAGAIAEPLRDVAVRVAHGGSVATAAGRVATEVGARVAVTGQTLPNREVSGPRLGVDARVAWTGAPGTIVPALEVASAATAYPTLDAHQTWVSVRPGVAVLLGDVRVDAAHFARWVAGASPFSARVDRVGDLQRSDVAAAWRAALPGGVAVEASAAVRYGWNPDPLRAGRRLGFEDLTVRASATVPTDGASNRFGVDLALAGRVDPRTDRDAYAALRWTWTRDRLEFGVRTTVGLEPGGVWRDATVFAAVPFDASPATTWRPYLAVDVLAFAGGSGPWLRGHGLDLIWRTCCGTLEVGYRSDAVDGATTHFAFLLPMRPLDPDRFADAAEAP